MLSHSEWSRSPMRTRSETCLNPTKTFSETVSRAAQPNLHRGRIFAHACKSRRAPRPRKPDETLSRHGLGARRVALLAPRGVLSKYRHPLSYAGAITKYFVKFKSKSRILGDENSIPSGGGVPEGRWGSLTPMSGDGSIFIPLSTPQPLSEPPETNSLFVAYLNTTNSLSECA